MPYGPGRPPRLPTLFADHGTPLFFVTCCIEERKHVLASNAVHAAFCAFAQRDQDDFGVAVGRYVLMPDHMHLFLRLPPSMRLSDWVRQVKRTLTLTWAPKTASWQRGFFDHLIRHDESYSEKWQYVRQNPVRAGLVTRTEEWPFQGEIVPIPY